MADDVLKYNFLGLCGSANRPCRLAWASTFPNQIGHYPANELPSASTTWFATVQGAYAFSKPTIQAGDVLGTPLLALTGAVGFGSFQTDIFQPVTTLAFSFVRTSNRVNYLYTTTGRENVTVEADRVYIDVEVPDYILDCIGVTAKPLSVLQSSDLTQEELSAIAAAGDNVEDYLFRRYLETSIPEEDNYLQRVIPNTEGVFFRLDNGTELSNHMMDGSGVGDLLSASYRDGTAKKVRVFWGTMDEPSPTFIDPGAKLYVHYVAVTKHYFRQLVKVSWKIFAVQGSGLIDSAAFPVSYQVANYRFYEWIAKNTKGIDTKYWGWRVVELCNLKTPAIYADGGKLYATDDNASSPTTNVFYIPKTQDEMTHSEALEHVWYNVHPEALKKPDVFKYGIERYLAQEIESNLSSGAFPFLDSALNQNLDTKNFGVLVTYGSSGATVVPSTFPVLSSKNLNFDPLKPSIKYTTALAEIRAGVGGGAGLGARLVVAEDVLMNIVVSSPAIQEVLEKDTKVLMERHYTYGQKGTRLFSIEAKAGRVPQISCVSDPSQVYTSVLFSDSHNHVSLRLIDNRIAMMTYNVYRYNTKQELPENPSSGVKGYNQISGEKQGSTEGNALSIAESLEAGSFIFHVSSNDIQQRVAPGIMSANLASLSFQRTTSTITMNVPSGYYGQTSFLYTFSPTAPQPYTNVTVDRKLGDNEVLIYFYDGGKLVNVIDHVFFISAGANAITSKTIEHPWVKCDSIVFKGNILDQLRNLSIATIELKKDIANDILYGDSKAFFEGTEITISEDNRSNLFCFYTQSDANIGCVCSPDFGKHWIFYKNAIKKINTDSLDADCAYPFAVSDIPANQCYLFHLLGRVLLCRRVDFSDIQTQHIETKGSILEFPENSRRSWVVEGKTDGSFSKALSDRSLSVSLSGGTDKHSLDIDTPFFSAYANDKRIMRCFYMDKTTEERVKTTLSNDDGKTWVKSFYEPGSFLNVQDLKSYLLTFYPILTNVDFSFLELNRIPIPEYSLIGTLSAQIASTLIIYLSSPALLGELVVKIQHYFTQSYYGIDLNFGLGFDCPYVFYKKSWDKVFLFYVWSDCLFCRVGSEADFYEWNGKINESLANSKSYFIDGSINGEVSSRFGTNFVFQHGYEGQTVDNFSVDRTIIRQRVCAMELPDGLIRIFYRNKRQQLRSAVYMGKHWEIDEFLEEEQA